MYSSFQQSPAFSSIFVYFLKLANLCFFDDMTPLAERENSSFFPSLLFVFSLFFFALTHFVLLILLL